MINPNKSYKAHGQFRITAIAPAPLWKVTVSDAAGREFTGYLDRLTARPERFRIGDPVRMHCRFSIMSDDWTIDRISKVRQ